MGSEPAGTWSGPVSSGPAGSSHYPGGTLQALDATPRKVTGSGRLPCVCLSQTDLTLRGPTPPEQRAVPGPRAQSITYYYGLRLIAAHLLPPVQLVTARLGETSAQLYESRPTLSPWQQTGEAGNPTSLRS